MQLDRFDLADIHNPAVLAGRVHGLVGPLTAAVPVVEIALALDIADIRLDRFDGFEGMLLTDARRSIGSILANTAKGSPRARFTVAHELGHFLMERHQLSDDRGFRCSSRDMRTTREGRQDRNQEAQANEFAITLLAPRYLISPFLLSDPDLRDAQRIRDQLDISFEACLRRMIDPRDEPLAAVWSHQGKVRYFIKDGGFPFVTLKTGEQVPKASAAFRAIQKGQRGFTKVVEAHPHLWTNRPELELYEQTRVAANGHAVTLLWAEIPEEEDDGGLSELDVPRFR